MTSGRYQNASEVLREGIRLIERRETETEVRLQALRQAAQTGVADIEAGRFTLLETPESTSRHLAAATEQVLGGSASQPRDDG